MTPLPATWLLAAPLAWANELPECERGFSAAEVEASTAAADAAYANLDAAEFQAQRAEAQRRLRCAAELIGPNVAASVHRVEALAAFSVKDTERVGLALAGMYRAAPGVDIAVDLLPAGHPIRALQAEARAAAASSLLGAPAADGPAPFSVDGAAASVLPADRACVAQRLSATGAVLSSGYLWPGDAPGAWGRGETMLPAGEGNVVAPARTVSEAPAPARRQRLEPTRFSVAAVAGGFAAFRAGGFLGEVDGVYRVSEHALVRVGVGFWSLARHYTRDEREGVAVARGVPVSQVPADEWNVLVPAWVGVAGVAGSGDLRPFVGADAVAMVVGAGAPLATGGRVHVGVEYRATPGLHGLVDLAGGLLYNEEFPLFAADWGPFEATWQLSVGGAYRF